MSFRETLSDVFHERTNFDFVGPRRRWFAFSGALIAIGAVGLVFGGLNLGIDFEGGTAWQVPVASGDASVRAVRDILEGEGFPGGKVQVLDSGGDQSVRVSTERVSRAAQEQVAQALARYAGADESDVSINDVGPTWGDEVSRKALQALFWFFIAVALYLSVRFEPKMAIAALAAVVHDIFITVGTYAVTGFEVTPATVIAFLTILGFSLYDTVVVFDKVKENAEKLGSGSRQTYSDMVNRSMNEVLMRSLNTSVVASLPVVSLLFVGSYLFGALTIRDFALALTVGLLTGAYSSIFVATPILAVLKERESRYKALRERVERSTTVTAEADAAHPVATPSVAAHPEAAHPEAAHPEAATEDAGVAVGARSAPATPRPSGGVAPRPRKQRRKRR